MAADLRVLEGLAERTRNNVTRLDRRVERSENVIAFGRIRALSSRGHLALVADRADIADQSFGEIHHIASRRLRQIGGSDDAA